MYRIEWKYNYQWRMEVNNGLTFETLKEAQKELEKKEYETLETRIVEVK